MIKPPNRPRIVVGWGVPHQGHLQPNQPHKDMKAAVADLEPDSLDDIRLLEQPQAYLLLYLQSQQLEPS